MQHIEDLTDPLEVTRVAVHHLRRNDISWEFGRIQFTDVKRYLSAHPTTGMKELGITDAELERWGMDYR
jgi:hypothetical protein